MVSIHAPCSATRGSVAPETAHPLSRTQAGQVSTSGYFCQLKASNLSEKTMIVFPSTHKEIYESRRASQVAHTLITARRPVERPSASIQTGTEPREPHPSSLPPFTLRNEDENEGGNGNTSRPSATTAQAHPRLPDARLEQQVAAALQPNARLEERLERVALPVQRVHDVRAGLHERRLEHVRQQREHGVQRLEVLARASVAVLDARQEFGEDRQVQDERRREERVLGRRIQG